MKLSEIVLNYRTAHALSQRQFAAKCKGLTNGYISMIESGINPNNNKPLMPSLAKLKLLAQAMDLTLDELLNMMDDSSVSLQADADLPRNVLPIKDLHTQRIPLIGSVAAGTPILAEESYDLYVDAPAKADYALRVEGDSMTPTFLPGDLIYIRSVPDVDDGRIGVVLLDDSAAVKHIYHTPTGLMLTSDNSAYAPIYATADLYDTIRILGAVVGFTRMF